MRLGFTKNRVLPLPEPPITSTFLFRAVLGVHHQPQCHRTGHAHRQIEQVEAGGGAFKGKGKAVRKVQQLFRQIRPSRQPVGLSQLAEQVNKQQVGQVDDYQLFHFRLHRDSPLSLIFSLVCWLLLAAAFSFRTARVFRMEGRSCCLSFLAVNSLNACSRLSACLDLKITIYRGGWVVRSFRRVKSMSYFLAQGLNKPMLASVISMLDRAEPSFLSCRKICWP